MNPTIKEITPTIQAAFNAVVPIPAVQKLFEQRLSLWRDLQCLYDTQSDIEAVLLPYSIPISAEYARINVVLPEEKLYTSKRVVTHEHGAQVTTAHTGSDVRTDNSGDNVTKNYIYPQGFAGAFDSAYISSEQVLPNTESTSENKRGTTDTTINSGTDTETDTLIEVSKLMEILATFKSNLIFLIDDCVFALFKNYWGVF